MIEMRPTPDQEAKAKAMLDEVRTAIEDVIKRHGGDKPGVAYLDASLLCETLAGLAGLTASVLPIEVKAELLPLLIDQLVTSAGAKLQHIPIAVTKSKGRH